MADTPRGGRLEVESILDLEGDGFGQPDGILVP